jgi:hypothetical protein
MGHEVPGMRGVYTHITPRMRAELCDSMQELWQASLDRRASLSERSAVAVLDGILASRTGPRARSAPHLAPKNQKLKRQKSPSQDYGSAYAWPLSYMDNILAD